MVAKTISRKGRVRTMTRGEREALAAVILASVDIYGVLDKQLTSVSLQPELVKVRQMVYYVLREVYGLSYVSIGAMMNRDHSTVMHGCKIVRSRGWTQEALSMVKKTP